MPKYLVVVESPAKARTINKFLGSNYIVEASYGHVRDLPKNELGVAIDDNFAPKYVRPRESMGHIKKIRDAAVKVNEILLATDPDREGEAIGWHIAELLKDIDKPVERIVFNAITKSSVREAAQNPRPIDENLVNAQQARRVLDRLVGYKLSPLLQWSIRRGLSAGRVQSVAVRMVCDRENEIREFVPVEYWTLDALLVTERNEAFTARLFRIGEDKPEISSEAQMQRILADLDSARYRVASVEEKEVRRRPSPPFITSSLQQEASRKLRFSPRMTMRVAQQLYEGVNIGPEGRTGLITYMRTDSTRLAPEAIEDARAFIKANYEPAMLPETPNFYASKKGAQDAHEAIRATSAAHTPEAMAQYLDKDQLALYTLVWQRYVACQMAPAVFSQRTVDVAAAKANAPDAAYTFRATDTVMVFPGFTKVYEESKENGDAEKDPQKQVPIVQPDQPLTAQELKPDQHFTKPPARYTEASLIRALEENGIGRPSTYAPIINTIQDREYVVREKGCLQPTDLGEQVNALLLKNFPEILNLNFTARLEDDLDHVEDGQREWHDLLRAFYEGFSKDLTAAQKSLVSELVDVDEPCPECGSAMEVREGRYGMFVACQRYPECSTTRRVSSSKPETTDEKCEQCGADMVIRAGRFGRFMSCSQYPKCKNTHNIDSEGNKVERPAKEPPKKTDQKCPTCGAFLLIRKSRLGEEFYGCEKYPKCKFTKPMELGIKCPRPDCGGDLAPKRAGRRRFIGCTNYPKCDFTVFGQIDQKSPCPTCEHPWTMVTKERGKGKVRQCPASSCGFTEELEDDET